MFAKNKNPHRPNAALWEVVCESRQDRKNAAFIYAAASSPASLVAKLAK
jgi:hypothetical protein